MACTTLSDAVDAMMMALNQQVDSRLLAMFGLRRDYSIYGHPVVPIGKTFTANEAADILRQNGVW